MNFPSYVSLFKLFRSRAFYYHLLLLISLSLGATAQNIQDIQQIDISQNRFVVTFSTIDSGNTMIRYGTTPSMFDGLRFKEEMVKNHRIDATGLSPATFYYVRLASVNQQNDTTYSDTLLMSTASQSSGTIHTYFTKSVDKSVATNAEATYLNGTLDDTLVTYINNAQQSLDIAIYNWMASGLMHLVDAVNNAYARGVEVRVITTTNTPSNNTAIDSLAPGIPTIDRPSTSGSMHHKFMVIDAQSADPDAPWVWVASTNFKNKHFIADANNALFIQDQSLALCFEREFNEMWGDTGNTPDSLNARFGDDKTDNTPHTFNVNGKRIHVYFSPSDSVGKIIKKTFDAAEAEIYFQLYVFTSEPIAQKIRDRVSNGVFAAGLMHDTIPWGSGAYRIMNPLMGSRLRVNVFAYLMHNKYGITDVHQLSSEPTVITGSLNWSKQGQTYNDETVLLIQDATIANLYYQEWMARYTENGGDVVYSVEENNARAEYLKIYPNPAQQELHLDILQAGEPPFNVKLYSVTGQLQTTWNIQDRHHKLTLPNLPGGVYFISIQSSHRQVVKKLLITD